MLFLKGLGSFVLTMVGVVAIMAFIMLGAIFMASPQTGGVIFGLVLAAIGFAGFARLQMLQSAEEASYRRRRC